ncbi:MAG TPA: hypothetical protein VGL42_12510 [Opitutaceae bacterium]
MKFFPAAVLALACAFSAHADRIIYSSGPISMDSYGDWIGNQIISDPFTVNDSTKLISITAGLQMDYQDFALPVSVDWSIGTSPGASDVGSGVATIVSNTYLGLAYGGRYPTYASTFDVSGWVNTNTTYWLTLTGGEPNALDWDINRFGPIALYDSQYYGWSPTGDGEAFSVLGVPDMASTGWLLGFGAALMLSVAAPWNRRLAGFSRA